MDITVEDFVELFVRATLHPDTPAALELSIALTEGSWTLASPHLILS